MELYIGQLIETNQILCAPWQETKKTTRVISAMQFNQNIDQIYMIGSTDIY